MRVNGNGRRTVYGHLQQIHLQATEFVQTLKFRPLAAYASKCFIASQLQLQL